MLTRKTTQLMRFMYKHFLETNKDCSAVTCCDDVQ